MSLSQIPSYVLRSFADDLYESGQGEDQHPVINELVFRYPGSKIDRFFRSFKYVINAVGISWRCRQAQLPLLPA